MANIKSAKKRARQAVKRRLVNKSKLSNMRTIIKRLLKAIQAGDKDLAQSEYRLAASTIDKTAKTNTIHKNKASRLKSRLHKRLKALID